MHSIKSYSRQYVDDCCLKIEYQIAVFKKFITESVNQKSAAGTPPDSRFLRTLQSFETIFFNNMIVVLDSCFHQRNRKQEGRDGNPLNEIRLLAISLLYHKERMWFDKNLGLNPATSILKYPEGALIRVRENDFLTICRAFVAEIRCKFP